MYSIKWMRAATRACLFFLLLSFSKNLHGYAADLSLSPSKGSYAAGIAFSVGLYVTGNQDSINAISANLNFDSDSVELQSISKSGSIITIWAEEPSFSNATGKVSLEGAIFNPGFNGTSGKVVILNFRAKKTGVAAVTIASGSVLSNDGEGTDVLKNTSGGTYTVTGTQDTKPTPPTTQPVVAPVIESTVSVNISSTSYPNQKEWYSNKNASFSWNLPDGVSSVRLLSDRNPLSAPTRVYAPPISHKEFVVVDDGVQYMHVQVKDSKGWGPVAHYAFQVDSIPPQNIKVAFLEGQKITNPRAVVKVEATDDLSGVATLEFMVDGISDGVNSFNNTNTYTLNEHKLGHHTGRVLVKDNAGNTSQSDFSFDVAEMNAPEISDYTTSASVGGKVSIKGTTYPGVTVEALFTDVKTKEAYVESTQADSSGAFTLLWKGILPEGVYEMKARAVSTGGMSSPYSIPRTVVLEPRAYLNIGISVTNWFSLMFILVLVLLCVGIIARHVYNWFKGWQRDVDRRIKNEENTLKSDVQGIHNDLENFYAMLYKMEKGQEITPEEKIKLGTFKLKLDAMKQEVQKLEGEMRANF